MYRAILVPLDGSAYSEQALPVATTIAHQTHTAIHLVQVHVPQYILIPDAIPVLDTTADQEQRDHETAYLAAVGQRLQHQDLRVTTAVIEGSVAPALCDYCAQHAIDLTVMTTHGRGALAQVWFGSVADHLVRSLPTPILLLHPSAAVPVDADPLPIRHILIPLDGSRVSEQSIDHALALGELTHATYTLLHVIEQIPLAERNERYLVSLSEDALATAQQAAVSYLTRVAADLRARAPQLQIAIDVGRPSERIATYAQQHDVDLIAMATHGRSGVVRWYLGSVATSMLRATTRPMLLYRPHDRAADQE